MDLLGSREAAEMLGIDRATLVRWIEGGKIVPLQKLPGKTGSYLFRREDVESLVAEIAS
jgi:excisionase family DNA binding protein